MRAQQDPHQPRVDRSKCEPTTGHPPRGGHPDYSTTPGGGPPTLVNTDASRTSTLSDGHRLESSHDLAVAPSGLKMQRTVTALK